MQSKALCKAASTFLPFVSLSSAAAAAAAPETDTTQNHCFNLGLGEIFNVKIMTHTLACNSNSILRLVHFLRLFYFGASSAVKRHF